MTRPTSPVVDVRATSTVVDVTVFLLLVSGAVATLVASTGSQSVRSGEQAAETAHVLASSTATVAYDPSETDSAGAASAAVGSVEGEAMRADGAGLDGTRTAHGTLAALLAEAAITGARIDGEAVVPAAGPYRRAVADAVRNGTGRSARRTQVRAVWEPYPDAPVGGSLAVGDAPPADATVHAATLDPGSGVDDVDEATASTAGEHGASGPADYRTVANATARAVVERLFPRNATLLALRGDAPADATAARRYAVAADALGVDLTDGPRGDADVVERRNRQLASALADRIAADLRERYESPADAAAAVDADAVEITVRTWSP